jgi:hypothetical protein
VKIRRISKILSVALLLSIFLYSTAVRELHYVFSVKYHTEAHDHQCDYHIHPTDKEDDCQICKIDVNHIYDHAHTFYTFTTVFLPRTEGAAVSRILHSTAFDTHYLRGPPDLT